MAVLGSLKFLIEADSTPVQRSAMAAAKALARLEGAVDRFGAGLKQQTRAVDQAERAHEKLAKTVAAGAVTQERSAASWAKEIAIFQRYRAALYLVGEGLRSVYRIAEDGARAAAAEQYFRNAGKSITEFRAATNGLISDAELMKKVNLADTMGLSGDVFKTLANVAHASAAKTGQSYEHMLNSIILGTARESRLLLDNLGIIVNVTDAKKAYAKSLKEGADASKYSALTVDQLAASLTDAAEKAAFFAEVNRTGQGPLLEQSQVGATAADNFDRFAAAVDNLRIQIGKLLAEGGESALAKIARGLQGIADKLALINQYGTSGGFLNIIKLGMDKQADKGFIEFVLGGPVGVLFEGAAASAQNQEDATRTLWAQTLVKLRERDVSVADALNRDMMFLDDTTEGLVEQFRRLSKILGVAVKKTPLATGDVDPDKLKAANEEAAAKGKALRDWVKKFDREMQEADDFIQQQGIALFSGIGKDAVEAIVAGAEESFYEYGRVRKAAIQAESDAYRQYENDLLEQAAKDKQKGIDDATAGVDQAHSIISAAMSGSASALGAGIGGFFGPLGTAIGSLIGELLDPLTPVIELLGHLASGIKGLLELGLNPFLETLRPLGPSLELLLRAIGVFIGGFLRPFIPLMTAIVAVVALIIDGISFLVVFFSNLVEAIVQVLVVLSLLGGGLYNIVRLIAGIFGVEMYGFIESMRVAANFMMIFTDVFAQSIVDMNNGIVLFIRKLGDGLESIFEGLDVLDLRNFGDTLTREDLMPDTTPIEENTDATGDNTRAVEQLSRDLRNLPSGYKVNYALYGATAPVRQYPGVSDSIAAANRSRYGGNPPNYRWRT